MRQTIATYKTRKGAQNHVDREAAFLLKTGLSTVGELVNGERQLVTAELEEGVDCFHVNYVHTPLLEAVVARTKREILQDIANGVEGSDGQPMRLDAITEFGDLHDYVDANTYGGVCDDDWADAAFGDTDEGNERWSDFCGEVQDIVHAWIKDGGMRADYVATYGEPTPVEADEEDEDEWETDPESAERKADHATAATLQTIANRAVELALADNEIDALLRAVSILGDR